MQLALVESPSQLLNVLEWAHRRLPRPGDLAITVLAPEQPQARRQLLAMAELALGTGASVHWRDARSRILGSPRAIGGLAVEMQRSDRLIIGDPFSGLIQGVLAVSKVSELVLVDDGSATIEFARQLNAGEDLVRWHRRGRPGLLQRQLGAIARRRLTPGSATVIEVFSAMPVEIAKVRTVRNDFGWTRSQYPEPQLLGGADLIGTSLVETGVVEESAYVAGVARLAHSYGIQRYLAHRKESWNKLNKIMALGLEIVRPDLPLEIYARSRPIARRIISFPSTVLLTLPLVLVDLGVEVMACEIEGGWLSSSAPVRSGGFLAQVTDLARRSHGLDAVAA